MSLGAWFGLAGVAPQENALARRAGVVFEWVLLPLALWLPIQWSLEARGEISPHFRDAMAWITWAIFVLEALVLARLLDAPARYFRGNWLNLVIIVVGLPLLWGDTHLSGVARAARLLVMLSLLANVALLVRMMLSRNQLGPVIAAIIIVTTLGGAIIGHVDPAFQEPMDGIWWAWVTVTTVGYGDLVPSTPAARVFAVLLMLLGVSLIALMSASLVSLFQAEEDREAMHVRRMIWMKLKHMEEDAEQRARHQDQLLERLAAIELALVQAVADRNALDARLAAVLAQRGSAHQPQDTPVPPSPQ